MHLISPHSYVHRLTLWILEQTLCDRVGTRTDTVRQGIYVLLENYILQLLRLCFSFFI